MAQQDNSGWVPDSPTSFSAGISSKSEDEKPGPIIGQSGWVPDSSAPTPPSAAARNFGSMTEAASGLPADIRDWPAALKSLGNDPFTGKPSNAGVLNAPANIVKGIVESSANASQKGIDQLKQPGVMNKLVGASKYIIGGLPIVGPNLVKAMEQSDNGDYAGMMGTLQGIGLQAIAANPDAAMSRIKATGQYLLSNPRVQEMFLADEAKRTLTTAEETARDKAHALYPNSNAIVPGDTMSAIANKAVNEKMVGSTSPIPGPLKSMMSEDTMKRLGAIDTKNGTLLDIYTKMGSDTPTSAIDVQGYYSELGKLMRKGTLDGDIYASVKQAHGDLGNLLQGIYNAEGKGEQWSDAQAKWGETAKDWWDKDSPIAQSLNAKDPTAILKPLVGDSRERAIDILTRNQVHGTDPNIVKAAQTFYKGVDQYRLSRLYQMSGGLMLAMMLRQTGLPGAEVAAGAGGLMGARYGLGWMRTRPMTDIFSEETPTVAGRGGMPRPPVLSIPNTPNLTPAQRVAMIAAMGNLGNRGGQQ